MIRNKMRKKLQRRTRPMETSKTRLARKATVKMQRMKMMKHSLCPTY